MATLGVDGRAATASSERSGRSALVLVGGANRGAYQAGVIQALVEQQGVTDGEPLDFDMIAGTSIGALNAYLVSTAQYSTLKAVWGSILARRNVFRLKRPYDVLRKPDAGILNRLDAAYRLGTGLTHNVAGILDPEPVWTLLHEYVNPQAHVHLPTYVSTTNLSTQRLEVFVRKATSSSGIAKQSINDELLRDYPNVRVATDDILPNVFFATAALPVLFDPVPIPRAGGSGIKDQYVDGGVTENFPFDIAHRCTDTVKVIVVDPPLTDLSKTYDNALEVSLGIFATMQYRILEFQVRLAYALANTSLPFTPYVIRPSAALPGKATDFTQQSYFTEMWERGYEDGHAGWQLFVPPAGKWPE